MAHGKPLHALPITSIDRRVIATRLAEIEETSGPTASNRVRTSLSAFLSWAAREGYIDANPAAFTNKAVENGSRERVLTDAELRTIWLALGDDHYAAIVKLLMLTGRVATRLRSCAGRRSISTRKRLPGANQEQTRARHPAQ
jgi:hypothetical protein